MYPLSINASICWRDKPVFKAVSCSSCEIETLTPAQVDYILTKDLTAAEKEIYFNAKKIISIFATSAPAGYTKVASVPDNGGTDEWFHPNVNTTVCIPRRQLPFAPEILYHPNCPKVSNDFFYPTLPDSHAARKY